MAKELRTAKELSDMIVSSLGVREIEISRFAKIMLIGGNRQWLRVPAILIGYQRRVEDIANRLRVQFALRE
jgi:hypothetical protein